MLRAYLQVFRIRGLSVPLLTSFAGSLPIGMLNLSVLLLVRLHGQSFGAAGIVAGALNLGSGAGLVAQGAWIDRRGQSGVLAAAGLVCAASLAALAAVVAGGGPAWLIATLAFAGGASVPAAPTAVRALCAALVADEQLRLTAYAMLAMLGAVLGDLAAVALGMAVFGAAEAVTGITLTALVQHVAPPGARTEPYAIIISAALAGIAVGNLAGGALAGGVSVRPVFMAAAGGAVVATTWAALRKHTLPGPREEHDPTRQ
jgi:MFS family permease